MSQQIPAMDNKTKKILLKKYDVQGVIGTGGMAVVYKAVQKTLNRPVAVKVVHQNLVHDTEFIDRFVKEARVAASLNHPNIITIYDVDSVDGIHYMTMEFLDGEPLSQRIKRKGKLGVVETLRIIIPIAQALNYLHRQGFVHRDVKSSNIFVCNDGRAVLMDFGIVFTSESMLSRPGTVLGTPEFMSPEQASGKEVTGQSDLYSLGVIMYECLSAKMPFRTDNPLTTVYKVIHEAPEELSSIEPRIPDWLNSQVLNLLSKNPEDRVKTGRELANNLLSKKLLTYSFEGLQKNYQSTNTQDVANTLVLKAETQQLKNEKPKNSKKYYKKSGKSNNISYIFVFIAIIMISVAVYTWFFLPGKKAVPESTFVEQNISTEIKSHFSDSAFFHVDQHPVLAGGVSAYKTFISQNLQYPSEAQKQGIGGKILVKFTVEKNGSISNVKAINKIGYGLDEEAVRLISILPSFSPGLINGEPVRVNMALPVDFKISLP